MTQWEVNKIMMTETWKTVVRVECLRERREVIRVHAQGTGREKNMTSSSILMKSKTEKGTYTYARRESVDAVMREPMQVFLGMLSVF